jgi:predicted DCC family thiol-disulfide oxidoreductase YuxK
MTIAPVSLYYDGLCVVCSAEINHYKKMRGSQNIRFVDITEAGFDAKKENLDPQKINVELHAKDSNGKLHIGVDAFILVWSHLDKLKWLSRLAEKSLVKSFLQMNYALFVKIRPYLPRRSCETSPYCEIKGKK